MRATKRMLKKLILGSKWIIPAVVTVIVLSQFLFIHNAAGMQAEQGILAQLNQKLIDIEHVMNDAQALQVNVLSPNVFGEAQKNFNNAKSDLAKGKDVKGISKNLTRAEELLAVAIKNAKEAKKQLPYAIKAREDAISAEAPGYATDLFDQAERYFLDAMKEIEDNDINGAIKRAKEGEDRYREAELIAIKASIIGSVHNLLKEAKDVKADKFAPQTFVKAQNLIQESENILNTDRSAQATAREKAEEAKYEANHAIYLSKLIQDKKRDDKNWEELFLSYENELQKVAKDLNMEVNFDGGIINAVQAIEFAVTAMNDDKKELAKELDQTKKDLTEQRKKVSTLMSELDATKQQEAGLKEKLEAKRRQEEKIKRIENLFGPGEAIVLREGDNIVIRLVGLNFASGKSVIEARYFGILTKVQRSIREFPDSPIVIEGHTDSRGHESANLSLSNARANAVKSYLIANMGLPESQIQSIGYGMSKPIATNETEAGRTKNRRIDIVLEMSEVNN
ncbi:OmpA family protein [candidate division KSB1 bacterium]|nr:OmpA family protein [candidate division KSB1 bacterium]